MNTRDKLLALVAILSGFAPLSAATPPATPATDPIIHEQPDAVRLLEIDLNSPLTLTVHRPN